MDIKPFSKQKTDKVDFSDVPFVNTNTVISDKEWKSIMDFVNNSQAGDKTSAAKLPDVTFTDSGHPIGNCWNPAEWVKPKESQEMPKELAEELKRLTEQIILKDLPAKIKEAVDAIQHGKAPKERLNDQELAMLDETMKKLGWTSKGGGGFVGGVFSTFSSPDGKTNVTVYSTSMDDPLGNRK